MAAFGFSQVSWRIQAHSNSLPRPSKSLSRPSHMIDFSVLPTGASLVASVFSLLNGHGWLWHWPSERDPRL